MTCQSERKEMKKKNILLTSKRRFKRLSREGKQLIRDKRRETEVRDKQEQISPFWR